MTQPASALAASGKKATRGQIFAWGLWDWGAAGFHTVIITFVFSVYITSSVGVDLCRADQLTDDGSCPAASTWLGIALGIAGFFIAVLAPVTGQRADAGGRRKLSIGVFTGVTVASMLALYFVKNEVGYLWLGLVLMGIGSITMEFASVSYNAMLRQLSTPKNIGRVSGFGWSMGYFGGIFLLLICYVFFISSDDGSTVAGLFELTKEGGFNIRVVALFAAAWLLLFGMPVLFAVPELPPTAAGQRLGLVDSYRKLFRDVAHLYRRQRHTVLFLIASALFRDGLAGVFTFGAVLAVTVYGFDPGEVLIFGVVANVTAALGAVAAGMVEDKIGPKTVIVISLVAMIAAGTTLIFLSGQTNFWIFGLALCVWVGPAQSSSRTYLARLTEPGEEGEMFGLYATTGRAVSFLAPALFAAFVALFHSDRMGIIGIMVVLAMGLVMLLPVRKPVDTLTRVDSGTPAGQ